MDTHNHVLDQGSQCSNGTRDLLGAKPHAETDEGTLSLGVILLHKLNFARNVAKVLGNLASSALGGNFSCLDFNSN